jgi:hypothetical protein
MANVTRKRVKMRVDRFQLPTSLPNKRWSKMDWNISRQREYQELQAFYWVET